MDPFNPGTVYLRKVGHFFRTSDGGRNWEQIGPRAGMLNESSLALHPREAGVLYFATQDGVFRSVDRGDTWQSVLPASVSDISICPTVPRVMYAAGRTLLRSQDGGETWEARGGELSSSDGFHWINRVAVHPHDPNVIFLGAEIEPESNDPGIYKSVDGGSSLDPIGLEGHAIATLAVDFHNPDIT